MFGDLSKTGWAWDGPARRTGSQAPRPEKGDVIWIQRGLSGLGPRHVTCVAGPGRSRRMIWRPTGLWSVVQKAIQS